jgi:hypothetical protein
MTVNQHREADVDLELQVLHEIKRLEKENFNVQVHYVKGHKQKTRDQFITTAEHMHNYADRLCKEARLLPIPTNYHKMPANNVDLELDTRIITAHAPKAITKAYHSINVKKYYRDKYQWNGNLVDSIWWKAYAKSIEQFNQPDKIEFENSLMTGGQPIREQIDTTAKDHVNAQRVK